MSFFLWAGHSWIPPPPPLIKGGAGVGPSKNRVTGGVPKILLEREDNPKKVGEGELIQKWGGGGGVDTFLLLYSSNAFAMCGEKVKFPLIHFDSSVF